jgi:hypothetical protein
MAHFKGQASRKKIEVGVEGRDHVVLAAILTFGVLVLVLALAWLLS